MTAYPNTHSQADTKRGGALWLSKQATFLLILVAILFGSAGRLDWGLGWLQVGLYAVTVLGQALILIPRNPALIAERSRLQPGSKGWDIVLASLAAIWLPIATWIVAGLDARYGWSAPLPLALIVAAVAVFLLSYGFVIWAMASNPFFAATVRIQSERGHTVATDGPYRLVRHPGYLGALVFQLATPFTLGSWWALIPSGLASLLYVVRTALEDKTLLDELDGYSDYARQVRYRLLPGVW